MWRFPLLRRCWLEREVLHLDREEVKLKREMKKLARDGQEEALRITAKNMIKLKKTRAQLMSTIDKVRDVVSLSII